MRHDVKSVLLAVAAFVILILVSSSLLNVAEAANDLDQKKPTVWREEFKAPGNGECAISLATIYRGELCEWRSLRGYPVVRPEPLKWRADDPSWGLSQPAMVCHGTQH